MSALEEPTFPPVYDDELDGRRSLASRIVNRAQLANLPKPSPLIDDTIDRGTVAVLAGYWGTCKSFVAQSWAASIATRTPWFGRPVEPSSVLYVAAEGAHGLDARLQAWEADNGAVIPADALQVLPAQVHLGNANDVLELCGILHQSPHTVLVIDTLAKCMAGMDENSSKDMGQVVANLYRLRESMGSAGTVVAVHHTGKDKATIRGSSALEAGVDTVYLTEGDPATIALSRTKRKDGPVSDRLTLTLEAVDGTESAVLHSQMGVGMEGANGRLLSHFRSHFAATGATSTQLCESSGMPSSSFYRARNSLVDSGILLNVGTDQRPFYQLVDRTPQP